MVFIHTLQLEEAAILAAWNLEMYGEAMPWNWLEFEDFFTRREFSKVTDIGTAVLDEDDPNRVSIMLVVLVTRFTLYKNLCLTLYLL